jgi:hypothetical protein
MEVQALQREVEEEYYPFWDAYQSELDEVL